MTFNAWYLENEELFDGTNMDVAGLKELWSDMELEGLSEETIYEFFSRVMNAILNC